MKILLRILSFLLSICFATQSYASAWTQNEGKGQLILNTLYYQTDEFFNQQGRTQSQNRFSKYELNPYFEYGLFDDLTVGANLSLQHVRQNALSNWVLGDSEFFVRQRLWNEDGLVISIEPMVKLPGYSTNQAQFPIASEQGDVGLSLLGGYGFSLWELDHFIALDTQYRYRLGTPQNQIRAAATLGISLTRDLMIMPQFFTTLRTTSQGVQRFTQSSGDDYNLHKLQLSFIYKLNDRYAFQLGGFQHVAGKNVGGGSGAFVSVWRNF